MDHVAVRVPRKLADEVHQTMQQRWRLSRSQCVEQALLGFLALREQHPDLPLKAGDAPLPVQFGKAEVWLTSPTVERVRDLCREHNRQHPEAPEVRLGHVCLTALLHAKASLIAHGHRQAAPTE